MTHLGLPAPKPFGKGGPDLHYFCWVMTQRPKVLACVVLHNILRTRQGRQERAPTPADRMAAVANEPPVCMPDENCKNPLMVAKHKQDLLKGLLQSCLCIGWAGQHMRCEEELP